MCGDTMGYAFELGRVVEHLEGEMMLRQEYIAELCLPPLDYAASVRANTCDYSVGLATTMTRWVLLV